MRTVKVGGSKEYDVLIGDDLLAQAGGRIAAACGGSFAMLVSDDTVYGLYGKAAESSMRAAGYTVSWFIFPHGEQSKNMDTYIALLNALAGAKLTRSDVLIALGGGVAGDLAGFAAATYLRGIRFAQIPTTLLAMVDSSVGGKTGVDLPSGKNLVGAFYSPDIVICDTSTLNTLPDDIFTDGCAEIIKYGAIMSAELFELLKQPLPPQIGDIITRCLSIKRDIVTADERENGIRRVLNFGHTIGHGIEKHSGYTVSHGKAVAVGMALTARGAVSAGFCGEDCCEEITHMLMQYGLPVTTDIPADQLIEAAFYDKKRSGEIISFILPQSIGACLIKDFTMNELAEFIRSAIMVER